VRGTESFLLLDDGVLGCELRLARTIWAPIHDASTWLGLREVCTRLGMCGVKDGRLGGAPAPETGPHNKDYGSDDKDWRIGAGGAQESARGHQSRRERYYYRLQRRSPQLPRCLVGIADSHNCRGGKRGENKNAVGMSKSASRS